MIQFTNIYMNNIDNGFIQIGIPWHRTSIATGAQLTREELRLLTFWVQPVSKHKRPPIQVLTEANVA